MAALTLNKTWTIELTTEELRLVLKALGGRIESHDTQVEACALGNRITELRGKLLKAAERDGERLVKTVATS